ncbi:MAG: type II toxin-antitoxin system prevent-host-death family antitoxin [Phycisphaerae bacterium]|nr:type II toxin-antitoxin system prevent-host-death family antitoxin [Phycisphaerae bacterium]
MTTLPITEARERLADLGNRVSLLGERVVVERRGKNLFALVPLEDLELLERLEDKMDLEEIKKSRNKPGKSWTEVKKALGL